MEKTDYRDFEDASVDIPKKRFRSCFTWFCYEVSSFYESYVMLACFGLLLCFPSVMSSLRFIVSLATAMLLLALTTVGMILTAVICITSGMKKTKSLVRRNIKAVAEAIEEVFSSEQETLALGWDNVACRLNRKFYAAGEWKTPYYYFDGQQCEDYFRHNVLQPLYKQKVTKSYDKSDLRAAVSIYEQRLNDQFNQDKEDITVLAKGGLPADSHRSKFIWKLKNSSTQVGLKIWFFSALAYTFSHTWCLRLVQIMIILITASAVIFTGYSPELSKTRIGIRLLATIADVAPGEDMDRWDMVAKRINGYVMQDSNDTCAKMFFDGKDCMKFSKNVLNPLMSKSTSYYQFPAYDLVPLATEAFKPSI